MTKIELLSPAGNWDCLRAAVENGADAVYLGIEHFNARRRANNFTLAEFNKVIDYCHEAGVKVYCTMNILIKNSEIKEYFETIKQLYLNGLDAVIIQHLSFLPIIKQNFPDLKVHLSTQAAITNSYAAELVKTADRVILPREFSADQINDFINKTKMPTEVFVQGALCFSYSGKCLFSSMIGGRSGNRGLCAQPCRKKYNNQYLLSMKDLCLLQKVPEMIERGVTSLKIEGRLRSQAYVTAATKTYRLAIDSYYDGKFEIPPQPYQEMELAFNRGFTEGHYAQEKELVSSEQPMGRGRLLGTMEIGNLIKLENDLQVGDGLGLWFNDRVDGAVLKRMDKDGTSVNFALAGETVKLYIRAVPGTKVYLTSTVKEPTTITVAKKVPIKIKKRTVKEIILPEIKPSKNGPEELLVKVYRAKDLQPALENGATAACYNLSARDYTGQGAYLPRMLNDEEVEQAVKLIEQHNIRTLLIGDLGVYALLKHKKLLAGRKIYLDYSNNLFNDYDLAFFPETIAIISPELNRQELNEFRNKNFLVLAHGRTVLMNTRYSLLPQNLKDELNYTFPVRKEHDYWQVLNSKELGLFEEILKLEGIRGWYLDLDNNVAHWTNIYRNILAGKNVIVNKRIYTKGHWDRGVM